MSTIAELEAVVTRKDEEIREYVEALVKARHIAEDRLTTVQELTYELHEERRTTRKLTAKVAAERRRIRRAIAPALKELHDAIGEQDRTGSPHQTRRLYAYAADIDCATRAPRKGRGR